MLPISLCIFDLDGVIVDTAKYHYLAWKQLAADFGYNLTPQQNEKLKGVSRVDSLDLILSWAGVEKTEAEKLILAEKKNEKYLESIKAIHPGDLLPGVASFLQQLISLDVKIALGSASKNAKLILQYLEITDLFDAIVDGTMTIKGKPDPEVFITGANICRIPPGRTVVFEDAPKGIDAAIAGGMFAVGVGHVDELGHADMVIGTFEGFSYEQLISGFD